MFALVFWLLYLLLAFIVAPAIFRARFGRWPFAYPLRRIDAYLIIDFAYGIVTIAFSVCLSIAVIGSSSDGGMTAVQAAGLLLGVLAVALIAWAVISLGSSWRIGQDRADSEVANVTDGPYRFVHHPVYVGLTALSIAMILLAGPTLCTVSFSAATIVYSFIQGWNENRHWRSRASLRRAQLTTIE